jgi:pyruvate/2-oxoglutarate/acetoin dehydrogenase E1 component
MSALTYPDPVIFLEPKRLYRTSKEDVPDGVHEVPIGQAHVAREGTDVSVITYGSMTPVCLEAANELAAGGGASVEVVDLRTLVPLDVDAVLGSVKKTGRCVIVHEAPRTCGFGAELAALVAERALMSLAAPIARVAGFDTPFPYTLEHVYLPDARRVTHAIEHVLIA